MPLRKVYGEGKIGTQLMSPNIHKLVPMRTNPLSQNIRPLVMSPNIHELEQIKEYLMS